MSQEFQKLSAEQLDPAEIRTAVNMISNGDMLDGFIAGYWARQAIEASVNDGHPADVQDYQEENELRGRALIKRINGGQLDVATDPTQGALVEKVGELRDNGYDAKPKWRGTAAGPEWSDGTFAGYLLGMYAGKPLLSYDERAVIGAGGTAEDLPAANTRSGVSLDEMISKVTLMSRVQLEPESPLFKTFSRDFGLRQEVTNRFNVHALNVTGKKNHIANLLGIKARSVTKLGHVALAGSDEG